jgi:hypothetical protein
MVSSIFQGQAQAQSLSQKMTRKAVVWLLTIAWAKDCSLQASWLALMLFYGYKSIRPVSKTEL